MYTKFERYRHIKVLLKELEHIDFIMALKKTKKIFRLKDISIDSIVDAHIRLMKSPTVKDFNVNVYTGEVTGEKTESKYANINKSRKVLSEKFTYLLHLIITRSHNSEYGWAYLSSVVLEKVFGKEYRQLIKTLLHENIIWYTQFYELGIMPYGYKLCDGVEYECTLEYEAYLHAYEDKLKSSLEFIKRQQTEEAQSNLSNDKLFSRYEESLSHLKLIYPNEAKRFLDIHPFISETSRNYYTSIVERYKDKEDRQITSVDKNKRIYSILTATPRLMKCFINISFSADIHNSHPLLFNKIICEHYSISSDLLNGLYNLLDNNHSEVLNVLFNRPHYVRHYLHKSLNISEDIKSNFNNIPKDVWEYIIITSLGLFWDVIIPQENNAYNELLRSDVKALLFSEVFYSKTMTTRCKVFAKIFKKRFPNVYKVVEEQKRGLEKDKRTVLSNRMMALESQLFHEVLTLLYNKRYKVVSIHDAIVVLDVASNKTCTPEIVKDIIKKVYRKNDLYPDVSIDVYGEAHMKQFMEDEESLSVKAQEYRFSLQSASDNGDSEATDILLDLDNGYREICYDSNHKIIAHLVDVKDLKRRSDTI